MNTPTTSARCHRGMRTVLVEESEGRRERGPGVWLAVIFISLLGVVAVVLALGMVPGDRERKALRIMDRTDEDLRVYVVLPDGTESLQSEVAANSVVVTSVECASDRMVAKLGLIVVATRGAFEECDMEDWTIPVEKSRSRPIHPKFVTKCVRRRSILLGSVEEGGISNVSAPGAIERREPALLVAGDPDVDALGGDTELREDVDDLQLSCTATSTA
jgi:hypothetical protein